MEPASDRGQDRSLYLFTLTVTNGGPAAVEDARVLDPEPPGLTITDWSCNPAAGCTPANGAGPVDTLVDLDVGESVEIAVTGTVTAAAECELTNVATVDPPPGVVDPYLFDNLASRTLTVFPPGPGLQACKQVTGVCGEGSEVTYTLLLLNPGPFAQGDNPGDEVTDTLPAGVTLLPGASATSGSVAQAGNTLTWNGTVGVLGQVTISYRALVDGGTFGQTLCNQAILATDPDGDGINDAVVLSDDPLLPGAADPVCFEVTACRVPALSPWGLAALALLLLAAGWWLLRRRVVG